MTPLDLGGLQFTQVNFVYFFCYEGVSHRHLYGHQVKMAKKIVITPSKRIYLFVWSYTDSKKWSAISVHHVDLEVLCESCQGVKIPMAAADEIPMTWLQASAADLNNFFMTGGLDLSWWLWGLSQLDPGAKPFCRFGWLTILVAGWARLSYLGDFCFYFAAHGLTYFSLQTAAYGWNNHEIYHFVNVILPKNS